MLKETGTVGFFRIDAITFQGQAYTDGVLIRIAGNDECHAIVYPGDFIGQSMGDISLTGGLIGKPDEGGVAEDPLVIGPNSMAFYDWYEDELLVALESPSTLMLTASGDVIPGFGPLALPFPNEPLASEEILVTEPLLAWGQPNEFPAGQPITFRWLSPSFPPGAGFVVTIQGLGLHNNVDRHATISCSFDPYAEEGTIPLALIEAVKDEVGTELRDGYMMAMIASRILLRGPTITNLEFVLDSYGSTTFEPGLVNVD